MNSFDVQFRKYINKYGCYLSCFSCSKLMDSRIHEIINTASSPSRNQNPAPMCPSVRRKRPYFSFPCVSSTVVSLSLSMTIRCCFPVFGSLIVWLGYALLYLSLTFPLSSLLYSSSHGTSRALNHFQCSAFQRKISVSDWMPPSDIVWVIRSRYWQLSNRSTDSDKNTQNSG